MAAQTDLIDQIEWRALECLNANPEHTVNNALKQARRAVTHNRQQEASVGGLKDGTSQSVYLVNQLQRIAA